MRQVLATSLLAALSASCAHVPRAAPSTGETARLEVRGRVTYARRRVTEAGLSVDSEVRPARAIEIAALDQHGAVVAQALTDEEGRYTLAFATPTAVTVRASTILHDGQLDARVLRSPLEREPHAVGVPGVMPSSPAAIVDLSATLGGEEPAGAFHILDRFLDGLRAVRGTIGVSLPPLIGLWRRGNTLNEAHTSFFKGESAATPGAFELQLMGGERGHEDASDSDQFDSAIILHEFGHFVSRVLGAEASISGDHDRRRAMVPGVAFDEAFATFFACAVLNDPVYLDSVGVMPNGHVRMRENMEDAGATQLRGVGTETTAFELLWDLADGESGRPGALGDRDADGVAIGLAGVLRVLDSFQRGADDYPYIGLFLTRAVTLGLVSNAQVLHLVKEPRPQRMSWPLAGRDVWPEDLAVPGDAGGRIDGVTSPAPSGGEADARNGFDAVRVYRIRVPRPRQVRATLRIEGSGRALDHQDLDLELYDIDTERLAASAGESATEQIHYTLRPGSYLFYVRDGGAGNRAAYRLEVREE